MTGQLLKAGIRAHAQRRRCRSLTCGAVVNSCRCRLRDKAVYGAQVGALHRFRVGPFRPAFWTPAQLLKLQDPEPVTQRSSTVAVLSFGIFAPADPTGAALQVAGKARRP